MIPATSLIVLLSTILTALGDVQRPTHGHQIGNGPGSYYDVIFPLTMAQCEPVIIYYNMTYRGYAYLATPIDNYDFLRLYFPAGVGYLDWICDIPTGYSFEVHGFNQWQYYTVQPGSSSACLGHITTAYSYASYYSTYFQSYTQHSPSGDPSLSTSLQLPTIDFPTSSFLTITANPNLAVTSTTTSVSSTTPPLQTPPPSSTLPHKSKKAVIAGGIIGGAAFILLTLALLFIFLRKRANLRSDVTAESLTIESEPKAYSGLMTSQPGLPYLSTPVLPSSERHLSHTGPIDTVRRGAEFTPNVGQTARTFVAHPVFHDPGALPSHPPDIAGHISSSPLIAPPVPPKPEQSTSGSSGNPGADLASALGAFTRLSASQQQALIASLTTAGPAAPEGPAPPASSPMASPPELPTSEAAQEELPDIATNILGVISRARLGRRERHALIASLLALDQTTPADLTRGNTISSPPPYAG